MAPVRKYMSPDDALQFIEHVTMNVEEVQNQVLRSILTKNSRTEYMMKFMQGSCDKSTFKKRVPIVTYEDIKPIIKRIADGDTSPLISNEPITEFITSSGTSGGEPKLNPAVSSELDRKIFFYSLLFPIVNKYIPGLRDGKSMYLWFIKTEMKTPSGLLARPVLTSYYKSKQFRNTYGRDPCQSNTSPYETIVCQDSKQSMYCQLLCGLLERNEVLRVGAVFASAFLRAMQFLEVYYKEMCQNIREGYLSPWISDPGCRASVSKLLKQDPKQAQAIEDEFSHTGEGIIMRLWPNTKYIEVIVTGSMAQYIPRLNYYSGGKLPLVCTMYACSECYCGMNLNPLDKPPEVAYTFLPNMAYFEFLPISKKQNGYDPTNLQNGHDDELLKHQEVVDLANVKVGHYYELVVTTYAGLYRYKVGDILYVKSFYNKAPQFQFVCRKNVVLSVDTDKTSEEDLHKAVSSSMKKLEVYNAVVNDYTSCVDMSSMPGHYVLFWEIEFMGMNKFDISIPTHVMEECCWELENGLDFVYRRCRAKDKTIDSLEIRVLKPGTFEKLMDHMLEMGASVNQYKTPRYLKASSAINLLNSNVVGTFFSQYAPFWEPCLQHYS